MEENYQVFISYRREGGDIMARLLYEVLSDRGYRVFYDRETMRTGRFDKTLLRVIESCSDFILVLSPGALDRCGAEDDWLRIEVTHALENGCQVIPVFLPGFDWAKQPPLPEKMQHLPDMHGFELQMGFFDSTVQRICGNLRAESGPMRGYSDEILCSLLQDPDTFSSFPQGERKKILRTLLCSMIGPEQGDMVCGMASPYLDTGYDLRRQFEYRIILREKFTSSLLQKPYFSLAESLHYVKQYLASRFPTQFSVGFFLNAEEIDDAFRDGAFLFRENFLITPAEMEQLTALPPEEQLRFYQREMAVRVAVDGREPILQQLQFTSGGIRALYEAPAPDSDRTDVRIGFRMPFPREQGSLMVSINEPTFSPSVSFSYPDDLVQVEMVPFLNQSTTLREATWISGDCSIDVQGEWILPMSGALFLIHRLQDDV